jgi:hypothetical protein
VGSSHITYTPRSDATAEGEVSALVSVYAYSLKNHARKKANKHAPEPVGRDDVKESNGYVATQHNSR